MKLRTISPLSKSCMARAGTTRTVFAVRRTVQSGYPVKNRPSTFHATNVAWEDHSGCGRKIHQEETILNICFGWDSRILSTK